MDIDTGDLPEPVPGYKYMPCRHCGEPLLVRVVRKKMPAHIECSIKVQSSAIRQMQERKGPAYEKWLKNTLAAAEALARGGAPLDE